MHSHATVLFPAQNVLYNQKQAGMERNRSGSSIISVKPKKEIPDDEENHQEGENESSTFFRTLTDHLGPGYTVGDLFASPRQFLGITYHHWLMVTAVDPDGVITEVIQFDPNEGVGTPAGLFGIYFGHPTVPHIIQRTDENRFRAVMDGMILRFVAY